MDYFKIHDWQNIWLMIPINRNIMELMMKGSMYRPLLKKVNVIIGMMVAKIPPNIELIKPDNFLIFTFCLIIFGATKNELVNMKAYNDNISHDRTNDQKQELKDVRIIKNGTFKSRNARTEFPIKNAFKIRIIKFFRGI
ncbi:MAG: hypothetical protein ACTSWN_01040 [Promethearchaeota archaeon]